ncbi:MAG: hypothetical protein LBJ63_02310 [Prevotellaceae bacterium]|jgi:hypothetical protein|nr:hypothetical protein [Prevotellaceae bacterium]
MKKLQGFNQYRHKTLQILKNLIFSSFVLIQKKQKIKASVAFGELVNSVLGDPLTAQRLTK